MAQQSIKTLAISDSRKRPQEDYFCMNERKPTRKKACHPVLRWLSIYEVQSHVQNSNWHYSNFLICNSIFSPWTGLRLMFILVIEYRREKIKWAIDKNREIWSWQKSILFFKYVRDQIHLNYPLFYLCRFGINTVSAKAIFLSGLRN